MAQKKVISRILSKQYMKHLQENTESLLDYEGFFRHPLELDIYQEFLPWLYQEIHSELSEEHKYNNFIKDIVRVSEREKLEESAAVI